MRYLHLKDLEMTPGEYDTNALSKNDFIDDTAKNR